MTSHLKVLNVQQTSSILGVFLKQNQKHLSTANPKLKKACSKKDCMFTFGAEAISRGVIVYQRVLA